MKGRSSRRLPGSVGSTLLAVASFFILWPFARLDFDRHHDGYMLAQAIAVHQGASVHADVFAQYGPVTPWVQSLALFFPMGPGLALRTLNVVFVAATVFFLADMGRKPPQDWPVSRAVGWWAAIAWIVLADVWLGISMLPWSSTLAAMLSVMTLYFLTRSIWCAESGSVRTASAWALSGGISLGLIPFTRINVGLSALAVCSVVVGLMVFRERGVKRTLACLFIFGSLLSMVTVVVSLLLTNSLADFYKQSIMWPLTWGRNLADVVQTQENLSRIFINQALPVLLVLTVLTLQVRAGVERRGWSGVSVFTVVVGLVIVIWTDIRVVTTYPPSETWWGSIGQYLVHQATSPNSEFLYFFMVLTIVLSVLTCTVLTFKLLFGDKSLGQAAPWLLLGGLALSGLTQIVPTWDPRHAWWAAPIGLLLLFSVVRSVSSLARPTVNPLMLPILLAALMAVFSGSAYWGLARVEGQPGTVAEGMLITKVTFDQINQDTQFLRDHLRGSQSVLYLVNDGDLSVLDGRYRSTDSYFVDWGGAPPAETRVSSRIPIVVQTSSFGETKIEALARSIKYMVVARNPRLAVLMRADTSVG